MVGLVCQKTRIQMLIDKHGLDIDGDYGFVSNDDFGIVDDNIDAYRMDKRLISVVKKLGVDKASGKSSAIEL